MRATARWSSKQPEASGRNGARVEAMLDDTDRDGDSFSSRLNDRNVSPTSLRGTAIVT